MRRARLLWLGTLTVILGTAAAYFINERFDTTIAARRTSAAIPHAPTPRGPTEHATRSTQRPRAMPPDNTLATRGDAPSSTTHLPSHAPAASSEPPAAARAAESAADEEIPRDLLRDLLDRTIQEKLPERDLSPDDVERLTDAVLQIRAARRALRQLPLTHRNATEVRRWQQTLAAALSDFQTVVEMSAADFTRLADPGAGLTEGGEDDAVVHEPLDNYPPPD